MERTRTLPAGNSVASLNPLEIIERFYPPGSLAYTILVEHSRRVAEKALSLGSRLAGQEVDLQFVEEAAMLHDIGIFRIHQPEIGCYGALPYICHGVEGRRLLERLGLPRHAGVCETHIGVGLTKEDIVSNHLPLPRRDMVPETLEEMLVCYADNFFCKKPGSLHVEMPVETILARLAKYGDDKVSRFKAWMEIFGV